MSSGSSVTELKVCEARRTLVAEIIPAASSIARWAGRAWSAILVWGVTPPVPPENTKAE